MSLLERRRPAFTGPLLARTGAAWALIALLLIATNASAILANRFPDPDDALRLIQVRDLIGGQGWFDLHQHRIDAASGGVPMHWSRLVDLPLAGLILLLRPLLGQPLAEQVTLVVVPLLTMGCAMLLAARIAWRLLDEESATLACLAMAVSVPLLAQMRPMRIDHHGWQVVAVLAAVNGLMARSPRLGGWITGLALAAGLAISIEGLPLAVAIAGLAALRWLRDARERQRLASLLQALAAGSIGLFFTTRGLADLVEHCDAISPVHLAAFAWAAIVISLFAASRRRPLAITLSGFALAAGGALAILALAAPQCTRGAFVELDPLVRTLWYDNVTEGLPVWHQPLGTALQIVIPVLVAIAAAVQLGARSRDWLRHWWFDYALLLIAALAVSVMVARAGAVAGALAAPPLGWQLREWLRAARRQDNARRRVVAMAGMMVALLPTVPLTLLALATPIQAGPTRMTAPTLAADPSPRASSCRIPQAAAVLGRLPKGDILAPLDIGPRLLLDTPDGVVATSHHRASKAMREVIDAFTGNVERAHAIVSRRHIAYVAICPGLVEPQIYYAKAPRGFAAQLRDGKAPAWLEPVPLGKESDFRLWRVVD